MFQKYNYVILKFLFKKIQYFTKIIRWVECLMILHAASGKKSEGLKCEFEINGCNYYYFINDLFYVNSLRQTTKSRIGVAYIFNCLILIK
jgi:hypothetical protein